MQFSAANKGKLSEQKLSTYNSRMSTACLNKKLEEVRNKLSEKLGKMNSFLNEKVNKLDGVTCRLNVLENLFQEKWDETESNQLLKVDRTEVEKLQARISKLRRQERTRQSLNNAGVV